MQSCTCIYNTMGVTVSFTVILYLKFFLKKTNSPIHVLHETKTTVNGDSTANWENSDMQN